jgi:hypothetical protein
MLGRRARAVAVCICMTLAGGIGASAAQAGNVFGGRKYTSSTENFRGVRASIEASRGPWVMGSTEIYVNRVVSERYTGFGGLVQIGALKAASNASYGGFNPASCSSTSLSTFGEYRNVNISGYYCAVGAGLATGMSYNTRYRFTIQRVSDCGTCWAGFINGVRRFTADVGYGPADAVAASGEVLDSGSTYTTTGGGEFGCTRAAGFMQSCASSGEREWEWTNGVNGTGETWTAVTLAQGALLTGSGFAFNDAPPGWWEVYCP